MAEKRLRFTVGSICSSGSGRIYCYRYQTDGRLQATNRSEAIRKAIEKLPAD